jgi:diacylglycerol kinase
MEQPKSNSFSSRRNSFRYAWQGLRQLVRQEPNAKLHAVATVIAIAAGFIRHISAGQWTALIIAIGLVWITEALNTCIEMVCNILCDNKFHPQVKIIKDIAAGAVLIAAGVSVVVGIVIFFF